MLLLNIVTCFRDTENILLHLHFYLEGNIAKILNHKAHTYVNPLQNLIRYYPGANFK